ncbi:uncharacterized protein [Ptychodera flava]|uniref:uncharacterized protein n=1 Tax=Ptychodera flava TaxID=63121 RepID=UPI00396A3FC3
MHHGKISRNMASSNDNAYIIVCAKRDIEEGFRYGPFKGSVRELSPNEKNVEGLWKLSDGFDHPGYAIECSDTSLPAWMRFIKPTCLESEQNMRLVDGGDHFFLEVTKNISTGVEYAMMGRVMADNQNGSIVLPDTGDALAAFFEDTATPDNSVSGISDIAAGDFAVEDTNGNAAEPVQSDVISEPPRKRRKHKPRVKADTSYLEMEGKRSHRCSQCGKVFVSSMSFMRHRHDCSTGYTQNQDAEDSGDQGEEGMEEDDREDDNVEEDAADLPPPRRVSRRGRRRKRGRRRLYGDYEHECEECGKRFLKRQGLVEHQKRHNEAKEFGCGAFECDSKFVNLGELVLHVRTLHRDVDGNLFICIPCEKDFNTLEEIKEHVNTHENTKKLKDDCIPVSIDERMKFVCEFCEKVFPTLSWMEAHREKHSYSNIAIFVCKVCSEAFRFITPYEDHLKMHEELNKIQRLQAEKFRCDNCHKAFRSMQMLEKHEKMFGDGPPRKPTFKCDYCGKRLTQAGLENHIQKYHPKEKPFKCTEQACNLIFKTKEERGEHLKEVHDINPSRAYVCPVANCNKAYASETTMTYHYQRVHTEERPFTCEICGKGWVKLSKLKEHLLTHTAEKNELCEICGRAFKTRPELRDHKIEMHTSSGKIKLQCRFCPATFSRRSSRSYHERRHKGEAPYICPKPGCNKRFIAVIDYKRHLIYHTGAKLYRCKFCGNSFTRSDYLRGHEKKHHAKGEELDMGPPIEETVTIKVPWPMEKAVRIQGQNVKVVIEPDPSLNNPDAALSAEAVAALEGAMAEGGHVQIIDGTHIPISSAEVAAGIIQQVTGDAAGNIVQVVTSAGQPIAAVMQQLPTATVQSVVSNVIQPGAGTAEVVQVVSGAQFAEQQVGTPTTTYVQVQAQQVTQQAVEQQQQFAEQDVTAVQAGVEYAEQQQGIEYVAEQPQQKVEFAEQQHQQTVEFVEQQQPHVEYTEQQQNVEYTEQLQQNVEYAEQQQQQTVEFTEQVQQPNVDYTEQPQQSVEYTDQQQEKGDYNEDAQPAVEYIRDTQAGIEYTDESQQQSVEYTDEVEAAQQLLAQAEAAAVAATQAAVQQEQQQIVQAATDSIQDNQTLSTVDLDEITPNYMQV